MTASLVMDQQSVSQTLKTLSEFPRAVQNKHVRIAMNAGGGVLKRRQEEFALKDTRLLAKSIRVKVKVPNASYNAAHHGRPAYAIVGPGRSVVGYAIRKDGKLKRAGLKRAKRHLKGGGKSYIRKPSRYAHLAEKKQSFIGFAQETAGQKALTTMAHKLAEGINQETTKYALQIK